MGSKLKIILPLFVLLTIVGVYAATAQFSLSPSTIYVNWLNASNEYHSGTSWCYSNYTIITNNNPLGNDITIANTSTFGGLKLIIWNGTDYNNKIYYDAIGGKQVSFLFGDVSSSLPGTYEQNIVVHKTSDEMEYEYVIVNLTVPQSLSNLIVLETIPKVSLGMNTVTTAAFSINNTEDYDLEIQQVENTAKLANGANEMSYVHTLAPTSITAKTASSYLATITINTVETNNAPGIYSNDIKVTTTNGCPNQTYNLTIKANLTSELDGMIEGVVNTTAAPNNNDMGLPGGDLTITIVPKYWDGTVLPGLDETSFVVWMNHTNDINLSTNANYMLTLNSVTYNNVGTDYDLDVSIPSTVLGGNYTIYVYATDGLLNNRTFVYNTFAIDQTALKMTTLDCDGGSLYVGNTMKCGFNLINYGYRTANVINVSYNYGSCLSVNPTNESVLFNLLGQANRTNYTTVTGLASGNCYLYINATTSDNVLWDVQNISSPQYSVSVYTAPTPDETEDPPLGKSGGGGEEILTVRVSKMSVTGPPTFEIGQGETTTQKVTVKNTGSFNINGVSLKVAGASGACTVSGTADLTVLELKKYEKVFDMVCKVPSTLVPGTYTLTITATGTDSIKKTVSAEGTAVLVVSPDDATKTQIDANVTEYKALLLNLQSRYNSSLASGKNVTNMTDIFNQITGLMTEVDSYISDDKYADAYGKLIEVAILLAQAESELQTEGAAMQLTPEMLLAIAGVVIVVVIVGIVYLAKKGKIKKPNFSIRKKETKRVVPRFKPQNVSKFDSFRDKFKR